MIPIQIGGESIVIMQNFKGQGKIYDNNMTYVSEVVYDIYDKSLTRESGAKWWGEISPNDGIMPVGVHFLELEEGRRGPCSIKVNTYSSFGLVVDSFDVEGTSPLAK